MVYVLLLFCLCVVGVVLLCSVSCCVLCVAWWFVCLRLFVVIALCCASFGVLMFALVGLVCLWVVVLCSSV